MGRDESTWVQYQLAVAWVDRRFLFFLGFPQAWLSSSSVSAYDSREHMEVSISCGMSYAVADTRGARLRAHGP